ncbi:MAG: non-homologous end-joining DNA ligase [Bryobacteraceae bacterium]
MLLEATSALPDGQNWSYEVKLDGYRALAIKSAGKVRLRSRNDKDFNARYPAVVNALAAMPDETVTDGEVVALDAEGRPSFHALQNHGASQVPIVYHVFDLLVLGGRDVMSEPLTARRELLQARILPALAEPIRESPVLDASLSDLVAAVRAQGLEGLVAKRLDSRYEPGRRSGAWQKMRINRSEEFVIGGYTPGARAFDTVIFGYWEGDRLLYAGCTRNGFTPASREKLWRAFQGLESPECPFANLPEARGGRWGEGLTAEKMNECRWLRPTLVARFEFVEWTPDRHLRHAKFVALPATTDPGWPCQNAITERWRNAITERWRFTPSLPPQPPAPTRAPRTARVARPSRRVRPCRSGWRLARVPFPQSPR